MWDQSFERTRQLLVERAQDRSLVLFIGSGVSQAKDVGLPGWHALLAPLAEDVGASNKTDDPLDIAQWYAVKNGRPALLSHVRTTIGKTLKPGKLHRALAEIPAPVIFTTNYDQLMERAITVIQGVPPDAIVEDAHIGFVDETRRTTVIKLHGCLSLPETIVLERDGYETYADNHQAMIAYLQSLLATRTFLFVGTSLTDPNFRVIHSAIRRALGKYQRRAYLLDFGAKNDAHVEDWNRRGVTMLLFPDDGAELSFVKAIGHDARGDRSIHAAAIILSRDAPPPVIEPGWLTDGAKQLIATLESIVDRARSQGLISEDGAAAIETVPLGGEEGRDQRRSRQEKLRAILDVAQSIDRLTLLPGPDIWIDLGNMLYSLGDSQGAIQSYNNALRPDDGRSKVKPDRLRKIRGNLARAYARQEHFARAEWLLRKCVFREGEENASTPLTRQSVFERLDLDHLKVRPTDASELTFSLSRRAERLRESGHYAEAYDALREARYLLEPLLGVSPDPALNHDLFADGYASRPVRRQWQRGESSIPQAYAFSFLGKCYRLSCALSFDLYESNLNPEYFLRRAVRHLRRASDIDPNLPYPWAHRLDLQAERRLPPEYRRKLLDDVEKDLTVAVSRSGHVALIENLLARAHLSDEGKMMLVRVKSNMGG